MAWSKLGAGEPQRPLAAPSLSLPSLAGCRGEQGIRSVPVLLQEQGHDQGRIHLLLQAPDEAVDRARPLLPAAEGTPAPLACSPVPLRAGGPQGPALPTLCSPPLSAVGYGGDAPGDDVRREAIPQAAGEMLSWPSPPCGHAAALCLVGADWEIPLPPAWCRAAGLPGQPVPVPWCVPKHRRAPRELQSLWRASGP